MIHTEFFRPGYGSNRKPRKGDVWHQISLIWSESSGEQRSELIYLLAGMSSTESQVDMEEMEIDYRRVAGSSQQTESSASTAWESCKPEIAYENTQSKVAKVDLPKLLAQQQSLHQLITTPDLHPTGDTVVYEPRFPHF